jgi:hypothetical protein
MMVSTDRWLGDWVEHADIDVPERLHISRATDDAASLDANGFAYLRHPLRDEMWYAPGVGSFLLLRDKRLWLSRGAHAEWLPFCRPGMAQLDAPAAPPTVLMTREALLGLFAVRTEPMRFELNLSEIDGRTRWLCRVWTEPGCERRMTDRAGLFDLRDLTAV